MAVWTKGFVATRNKSPFFVLGLIESALNQLIGTVSQTLCQNRLHGEPDAPYAQRVQIDFSPSSKGAYLNFICKGEPRQMTVYFAIDGDRKEYTDSSIGLMMGASGNSELYIRTALNALRPLGEVWFLDCDATDKPFEKLDIPSMSYLDACRQKIERASCVSLKDWIAEFRSGTMAATTELDAFGFPFDEALRIVEMDYDDSARLLKELAGMLEAA